MGKYQMSSKDLNDLKSCPRELAEDSGWNRFHSSKEIDMVRSTNAAEMVELINIRIIK